MLHHKFERDDLSVDPIATCCKPSTLNGRADCVVDEVNDRWKDFEIDGHIFL